MWREIGVWGESGQRLPVQAWETTTRREAQRGLLDQTSRSWSPREALALTGAPLIHTFGMQMPIDVVWVRGGVVVKITEDLAPGRLVACLSWRALELGAGGARELGLRVGQPLSWGELAA